MGKKRRLLLPALLLVLALPFSAWASLPADEPTDAYFVNDFAGVLNTVTEDEIANNGYNLADGGGPEVVLVTVTTTGGADVADYALSLFNTWKIGDAQRDDGLLVLFAIEEQDGWVLQGTGLDSQLSSGEATDLLVDNALDEFMAGNYDAAALGAYRAYVERLGGSWNGEGAAANPSTAGTNTASVVSSRYVYDETGRLSDGTVSYLQNMGDDTKDQSGAYVSVAMVGDIGGADIDDYARKFFDDQGLDGNAVLVMITLDDGCSIIPGEYVDTYVDPKLETILYDYMYDPYMDYDFDTVARDAASQLSNLLIQGRAGDSGGGVVAPPAQQPQSNNRGVVGGIGSAIASFFTAIFVIAVIVLLIVLCAVMPRRRRYYRSYYGVPFNPFSRRYVRRYGPGGYWGHWDGPRPGYHAGPPPMGHRGYRNPPRGGGPGAPPSGGVGGGGSSRPVGGGASKTSGASFGGRSSGSSTGSSFGSRGSGGSSRSSGSSFGGSSRSGGSSFGGGGRSSGSRGGSFGGGSSRGGGGGFRGGKR